MKKIILITFALATLFSCTKPKDITYNSNVTCSFKDVNNIPKVYKYQYNFIDSSNSIVKIDSIYIEVINKGILIFNGDPNAFASTGDQGAYFIKCSDNYGNFRQ